MEDIKAILFDCFGVLYPQAAGAFFHRNDKLFAKNPAALDELNLQIDLGQISRADFFKSLEVASGLPASSIMREIDNQLQPDQNLIKVIADLKRHYKIALLSNAGKEEIEILYRDNLDELFDAITVSYQVGFVKPNPEIFHACVKSMNLEPSQCLFVDDSKINLEAAQKLSLKTLHYPSFGTIPDLLLQLVG